MLTLKVIGKASSHVFYNKTLPPQDLNKTLLNFLEELNLPIASSCFGEGVCKKCIVNQSIVSCQITLEELINKKITIIHIDYL